MAVVHISADKNAKNLSTQDPINIQDICELILDGHAVVLIAPFGAGKSLTTREIFKKLSALHREDVTTKTPIVLNLREHWGQDFSDEILERHARSIGYTPREDLVIAWRAAMASLLLDGFDEVASQTVIRTDDKNFMKEARRKALQGARDFTRKIPGNTGIFMCGRDHYFDTYQELLNALGISTKKYVIIKLDEFTEEGVEEFLRRNGITQKLPDWLPRKPLILAYLLQRNLFQEILQIDSSQGFGYAWDNFLNRICEREASLENAVMDPQTLRFVMERLASTVRSKSSGNGPITGNDLSEAYNTETGQAAGEGVLAQLQRLPGLTQRDNEPGSRSFVDEDMLAALQGSAFSRQALSNQQQTVSALAELSEKAISMATYVMLHDGTKPETLISIAERHFRNSANEKALTQTIADCAMIAINMAMETDSRSIDFRGLIIDSASLGSLNLEEISISGLEIRNCTIKEIAIGPEALHGSVKIVGCLIGKLTGIANENGIPKELIIDCEVTEFDNMATNNAVMHLDIPPQLKALLSILRKIYKQAGAGRKVTALARGITNPEAQRYINPTLEILQSHNFITIFNKVVHPVRKQLPRVESILNAPNLSKDPLLADVLKI